MRAFAARHGRWLTLDENEIDKAIDWFEKHGRIAVLLARLVPTVRTLISLPAGMARMPLAPFLIYSAIGTHALDRLARCLGLLAPGELNIGGRLGGPHLQDYHRADRPDLHLASRRRRPAR
jgi:membrane protein DedA with SNARE-associated domain